MKRIRKEKDRSKTVFEPLVFKTNGPYRVEIKIESLEELRELKKQGKLVFVRMIGYPSRGQPQRNLVPWKEIEDFDW